MCILSFIPSESLNCLNEYPKLVIAITFVRISTLKVLIMDMIQIIPVSADRLYQNIWRPGDVENCIDTGPASTY